MHIQLMMIMMMKLLFLVFVQFSLLFCGAIWPTIIDKSIDGYETYAVKISIGVPEQTCKMQISFSHDDIIVYKRLDLMSIEYSPEYGGSDILNVQGHHHRVPITLDPYRQTRVPENPCKDCD